MISGEEVDGVVGDIFDGSFWRIFWCLFLVDIFDGNFVRKLDCGRKKLCHIPTTASFPFSYFRPEKISVSSVSTYKSQFPVCYIFKEQSQVNKENFRSINNTRSRTWNIQKAFEQSTLLKYYKFCFLLYGSGNLFYEDISTNPSPFFAVKIGTLKTRGQWKEYTLRK